MLYRKQQKGFGRMEYERVMIEAKIFRHLNSNIHTFTKDFIQLKKLFLNFF